MTLDVDQPRADELSALTVPHWVRGVWQRTLLRAGDHQDRDSMVIWIQTPTLYADIRAPALDDASPRPTPAGFAGWLDVEGQVCRWHRPIDLNPGPEGADQGAMFRDGEVMTEVGLLANYLEDYHLIDPATRCFAASRGAVTVKDGRVRFAPEGALDILVTAGPYVTHARRAGSSSLRHGRYDAGAGAVSFDLSVGDPAVFASGRGTWTVWTDEVSEAERDALLAAAEA